MENRTHQWSHEIWNGHQNITFYCCTAWHAGWVIWAILLESMKVWANVHENLKQICGRQTRWATCAPIFVSDVQSVCEHQIPTCCTNIVGEASQFFFRHADWIGNFTGTNAAWTMIISGWISFLLKLWNCLQRVVSNVNTFRNNVSDWRHSAK